MAKYAFIGAVILGAAIVGYVGCGGIQDRVGVVADKALQEIDNLIGNLDVQRKTVERKFNEVQVATQKVAEERVRFEVRYNRAVEKQQMLATDTATVVKKLGQLKELLTEAEETGKVTRNGREFTKAKLAEKANDELKSFNSYKEKKKHIDIEVGLLKKNLDVLNKQKSTSEQQLKKLSGMIVQIDQKIDVLKSQRSAESVVLPSKDMNTGFDELQASVDKLGEELDVQMAVQDEKLEARILSLERELEGSEDADLFVEEVDDISSTMSDLDKALSGE